MSPQTQNKEFHLKYEYGDDKSDVRYIELRNDSAGVYGLIRTKTKKVPKDLQHKVQKMISKLGAVTCSLVPKASKKTPKHQRSLYEKTWKIIYEAVGKYSSTEFVLVWFYKDKKRKNRCVVMDNHAGAHIWELDGYEKSTFKLAKLGGQVVRVHDMPWGEEDALYLRRGCTVICGKFEKHEI